MHPDADEFVGQEENASPGEESGSPITCDQEAWLKKRLGTLVRMTLDLRRQRRVCADDPLYQCAVDGLINGAAVEVAHIFYQEPCYENLRRVPVAFDS